MMLAYRPFGVDGMLGLALVTLAGFSIGCSAASPTAPQPPGGTPAAAERRVDAVGGGEGVCEDPPEQCPPRPAGSFTLTVPNGDTLSGIRGREGGWVIAGGTGRYASAGGTATFQPLSGSIAVTFNFGLMHPSPPVYTDGTLVFVDSTDRTSLACASGVMTVSTYGGTLESFGRVTLELEVCAD